MPCATPSNICPAPSPDLHSCAPSSNSGPCVHFVQMASRRFRRRKRRVTEYEERHRHIGQVWVKGDSVILVGMSHELTPPLLPPLQLLFTPLVIRIQSTDPHASF